MKETSESSFIKELEEKEVSMGEGENAEERESVGREVERHQRNERDELVSIEERPERLERDVPRVRRRLTGRAGLEFLLAKRQW